MPHVTTLRRLDPIFICLIVQDPQPISSTVCYLARRTLKSELSPYSLPPGLVQAWPSVARALSLNPSHSKKGACHRTKEKCLRLGEHHSSWVAHQRLKLFEGHLRSRRGRTVGDRMEYNEAWQAGWELRDWMA
jgi:hypothetical protein